MEWSLEEALRYYRDLGAPGDQSALISLLREVQRESGGTIPSHLVGTISETLGIKDAMIHALVRRIPSLKLGEGHVLELCAGPNCGKAAALAAFAEKAAKRKNVSLRYVPCMRMCGKGPNLRWDGKLHHRADEALLRQLLGLEKE